MQLRTCKVVWLPCSINHTTKQLLLNYNTGRFLLNRVTIILVFKLYLGARSPKNYNAIIIRHLLSFLLYLHLLGRAIKDSFCKESSNFCCVIIGTEELLSKRHASPSSNQEHDIGLVTSNSLISHCLANEMVVYLYSTRQITKVWAEAKRTWREAVNKLRGGKRKGENSM